MGFAIQTVPTWLVYFPKMDQLGVLTFPFPGLANLELDVGGNLVCMDLRGITFAGSQVQIIGKSNVQLRKFRAQSAFITANAPYFEARRAGWCPVIAYWELKERSSRTALSVGLGNLRR